MVIVSKQLTVPSTGKQLSDYAEGDIVQIPENGVPVEFYVAKHDYESSLNGPGKILVVRKDVYDQRAWNSSAVNAWTSCTMRSWLNSTYKALLAADIQEAIGTTTYRYTPGNYNNTVTTRSDAVFLLSLAELGQSYSSTNVEGTALPIASTLQIAYQGGNANTQWTRSPFTRDSLFVICLNSAGAVNPFSSVNSRGSRPAFTLPSTTKFDSDTNIIIG